MSQIRPRFKVITQIPASEIVSKLKQALNDPGNKLKGEATEHYTALYLPLEDRHYWSPMLNLSLEQDEEGTIIRGLYGPRPNIWTMFVFFYSTIAFAIIFIAMLGFSQLSLGNSAPLLWLIPVLLIIFSTLYVVAYFGKKKSEKQMDVLHDFVEKSIGFVFEE
ncbi:hypothetical protein SAMN06298216_0414 [Spirosomataceae bacterium TFI 002]|nr:hypothetical protein SAMN06298216_0414 [Spirosomataceae bacterium TFI 002]